MIPVVPTTHQFMSLFLLWVGIFTPILANAAQTQKLVFAFSSGDHGFLPLFADYPSDFDPDRYQLTSDHRPRPANLGSLPALFISGVNHSDDLWMSFKKKLGGFQPHTTYLLTTEIEFASNYPTGSFGIGGSPADSVYVKSGATTAEPRVFVDEQDWFRLNLDKSNQSSGGEDAGVLGTVAKPEDGTQDYVLVRRHNLGQAHSVTTDDEGSFWLIFGTDSGFEGETALYYTRLTVWMHPQGEPYLWSERNMDELVLIWNEGTLQHRNGWEATEQWQDLPSARQPYFAPLQEEPRQFWRLRLGSNLSLPHNEPAAQKP